MLLGPICFSSSTVTGSSSSAELFPFLHQGESSSGGDRGFDCQRRCRASSSVSRFLIRCPLHRGHLVMATWLFFGVLEASDRFVVSQRVSSCDSFLDGIESVSPSHCQEIRLDDLNRPQGCVSSGSHSSRQSQVSSVCCGWQGLLVLSSVLQSLHSPSSVHQGHGSSVGHVTLPGHQDAVLSRRLARSRLFSLGGIAGEGLCSSVCSQLGIVVNLEKSCLVPSQTATYLGMVLVSPSLRTFPTEKRVSAVLLQIEEFLSCRQQGMLSWRCLLGRLASLCHLVPGGRLRMRSLQLRLRGRWDFADDEVVVSWTPEIESDLRWWSNTRHLLSGVSSGVPAGSALLVRHLRSGLGCSSPQPFRVGSLVSGGESSLHQSERVRAIRLGLRHFHHLIAGLTVGIFFDSTTALAYVRKQGSTLSSALNREAQLLIQWAESLQVSLVPQFIMGSRNIGGRFLESEESSDRVRMDSCPGGGRRSVAEMASNSR